LTDTFVLLDESRVTLLGNICGEKYVEIGQRLPEIQGSPQCLHLLGCLLCVLAEIIEFGEGKSKIEGH